MNTEKKAVVFGYRRGTIRLFLIVCTGLWLVAALVYAGRLIDRSWLTPSERKAAVEALKDVYAVRNFGMIDDSAYDAQVQRAEAAVAKTDVIVNRTTAPSPSEGWASQPARVIEWESYALRRSLRWV